MRQVLLLLLSVCAGAEPLRLHPDNPHYFLFRGKPVVLVTSGEHYGAVLNVRFDFRKYLDALASNRLNLTRIFTGLYREVPGSFNITENTLAPEEADFLTPFARVGPNRYDLDRWNNAYWMRLREFVAEAGKRGIIVEVTLFTTYYNDTHWNLSPLNAKNNLQRVGAVASTEPLTLKDAALIEVQDRFLRKMATELKDFDNLYYEICNEPYFHGPTREWQQHVASVIAQTETKLGTRHLISENVANNFKEVQQPFPELSIFNFHYARPPKTVAMNYGLNKIIGLNETGFDGTLDSIYRIQAWDFLVAGGALYNNLDYSFTVGHEDGTFLVPGSQPGGGSPTLRAQLKTLVSVFDQLPFVGMKPDEQVLRSGVPETASARILSAPGKIYAMYLHHGRVLENHQPRYVINTAKQRTRLIFDLPAGTYSVRWIHPKDGKEEAGAPVQSSGKAVDLQTPEYTEDLAAIISKQ